MLAVGLSAISGLIYIIALMFSIQVGALICSLAKPGQVQVARSCSMSAVLWILTALVRMDHWRDRRRLLATERIPLVPQFMHGFNFADMRCLHRTQRIC